MRIKGAAKAETLNANSSVGLPTASDNWSSTSEARPPAAIATAWTTGIASCGPTALAEVKCDQGEIGKSSGNQCSGGEIQ